MIGFSSKPESYPKRMVIQIAKCIATFVLLSLVFISLSSRAESTSPIPLPKPSQLALVDYEKKLYQWILKREYSKRGWKKDKTVRDTGPFIDGVYYGTHPAVRIYYSPEIVEWLEKGRPSDYTIPDGAMIVKEMYTPPAAIYQQFSQDPKYSNPTDYEELLQSLVNSWTVMVKDNNASSDGWFWASVGLPNKGQSIDNAIDGQVDTLKNRGNSQLQWSGFAMPCLRCHASAKDQSTFSDLANIIGKPLIFKSDDSWRSPEYIANNYPLCEFKDDEYVKKFMYLPPNQIPADQIACPPKMAANKTSIFSDHIVSNNTVYKLPSKPEAKADVKFIRTFSQIPKQIRGHVKGFPSQWLDASVMAAGEPTEFISSTNCIGCHGGLSGSPNRAVMFVENGTAAIDGFDVSEYGEWRWSPMGLAGRDPIFHAQIESEMAYLKRDAAYDKQHPDQAPLLKGPLKDTQHAVQNLCLSCHGAMGQRQLAKDAAENANLDSDFKVSYFNLHQALTSKELAEQEEKGVAAYTKYSGLAREGISCMVCHRIDAPDSQKVKNWQPEGNWLSEKTDKSLAYNLFFHSTGKFNEGPVDEILGPVKALQKPMLNALNVKPVKNHYTSDSQMCGSCHTINLPNIGAVNDEFPILTDSAKGTAFEDYSHSIEQATFLEWQNSVFAVEGGESEANGNFKSCQDCHMAGSFENTQSGIKIKQLLTQIASIQDSSYPQSAYTLKNEEIDVPMRDDYKRHTNVGLNVFLLTMVDQFSELLGLQKSSYMTSSANGIAIAIDAMVTQAQSQTADISVSDVTIKADKEGQSLLTAHVSVTNKSGHRYPSGVAFRRAFIEFSVTENDNVIWQSGGTNSLGVIVDGNKQPLKTEFLPSAEDYQHHHQVIENQHQVQIYEELNLNAQKEFTTSFVHRVKSVKDNRLLPKGWRESRFFADQGALMTQFMQATDPHGKATTDADYQSGDNLNFSGSDHVVYKAKIPAYIDPSKITVKVTLYNQSIPPYWLKQRFDAAPNGIGTKRLHYIASHLDLKGTPIENWKLAIVSDSAKVIKKGD
jgi:mono/diheme cytochrome c family protein